MMSPLGWLLNPPRVEVPVGAGRVVLMFSGGPVTPERAAQVVLDRDERAEAAQRKRDAAVELARGQREALEARVRERRESLTAAGKLTRRRRPSVKMRVMAAVIRVPDVDYEQIAALAGLPRRSVMPALTLLAAAGYLEIDAAYIPRRYQATRAGVHAYGAIADALA